MLESSSTQLPGKVYLVGAGPGDPGLLTLRAQQCLAQADVVLYDYLVNVRILRHAPPNAELVCSGGHGRHNKWPQPKINQRMIDEALAGKCVVRLKSGDPIIFGRAAEEFDALIANQIPFEVVPGITAALAAGSYAGLPLTHRDSASSVAFVTGHQQANNPTPLDYQALAQFPGTLVFYMGVTTAKTWSSELIRHGLPADTSVALVRRCSWPDQQTIRCRLDEVAERVTPYQKFPPPAIAV
ncbi:MAG: uroporphyrinogen-III C-methyltransferase, partial [Planctomycetales bacterium]|nr:uroporphyrinogen-III C-methyltransferase [Planctomycetales bacterium]